MKEKTALIIADELPTDVAGGEALLDRHQQHKVQRKAPLPLSEEEGSASNARRFLAAF